MPENTIEQLLGRATERHRAGDLAAAEAFYQQILEIESTHAPALHLLGIIKASRGELPQAIKLFEAATRSKPDYAEAHYNLGKALQDSANNPGAAEAYMRAIVCRPLYPKALNNRGVVLQELHDFPAALLSYDKVIESQPTYPDAHYNRATLLERLGRMNEAIVGYRSAIEQNPKHLGAQTNLGNALQKIGRFDEAIALLSRIQPPSAISLNALGNALKEVGRLDEALTAYRCAADAGGGHWAAGNYLYATHFSPAFDAQGISYEHTKWNEQYAKPLMPAPTPHVRTSDRLRVGFVSPDLREHPVGRFMLPLVENLDRERFEISCFSDALVTDSVTARFQASADKWHETSRLNHAELAELVRTESIDVLVDLTMHMEGSRLLAFARKPAPLQMTYLAYCSTTGLTAIDHRLTDPYLDPVGIDESDYSEKTLRLPHTYWCYRPTPESMELPAERCGKVVFGCLNNYCKISEPTWDAWIQILQAVPKSRLLIFCPEGNHRETAFDRLAHHGVDRGRLSMIARMPREQYFHTFGQIDIALDPFPYGGGTTTLDGLWAGVPVVSLTGQTAVGRGGASILNNLGRAQWLARDVAEYVRIATELAGERIDRLSLREQLRASPLMDEKQFARDFGDAIAQAWHVMTGVLV